MLPVCSATSSTCSHCQVTFQVGTRNLIPLHKFVEDRCIVDDRVNFVLNGVHSAEVSFKPHATKVLYAHVVERSNESGPIELANISPNLQQYDATDSGFSDACFNREHPSWRELSGLYPISDNLNYVETPSFSGLDETTSTNTFADGNSNVFSGASTMIEPPTSLSNELQSAAPLNGVPNEVNLDSAVSESAASESLATANTSIGLENASASDTLMTTTDAVSKLQENYDSVLSGINESVATSVANVDSALKNSYNSITSLCADAVRNTTESFEKAINSILSSVDNTSEVAGNKLSGFSSDLGDTTNKVGGLTANVLRRGIISVEGSLANAGRFVVYSYGYTKELLPGEVQNVLNLSEERAMEILGPVGTALQQVNLQIEGLEKYLGFDPNDPIVPFVLLLGSFTSLWITYWVLTYGGYSGDLSPEATLELLSTEENVVVIDVRPEDLRERDGIPDLRRGARFKYASVTFLELGGSLRKLLRKGREIDNALVAVVIRNLKIVRERSKVIVLDASGAQSKGIARSLRKIGVKKPYLVQGGYQAWVKSGLRIKELKPETTLTILNEEAEAIIEDIRPTPLKLIGYGMGLIASIYALVEWERTLQFIGIIGLGQTIYRRVSSYEDSEDLKRDVRLLLTPVRVGAQAFSWVAGKVEPAKIGLPTSPSSTAVQSRVLQAAAKHESQPSDAEQGPDPARESPSAGSESLDLSEA